MTFGVFAGMVNIDRAVTRIAIPCKLKNFKRKRFDFGGKSICKKYVRNFPVNYIAIQGKTQN